MSKARLPRVALVALAFLCQLPAAQAQDSRVAGAWRVECSSVRSRILARAVRFCALLPPSYDREAARRYPVLYYLHGLGENEQSLVNFGGWNLIENIHEDGRIGDFLIVTPDGGQSFYLNSRDGKQRYEDFFIHEFIPAIDARYRTRAGREHRGIGGTSMGGFGALRLAFSYPRLFVSVTAHSAALFERLPSVSISGRGRMARRIEALEGLFGMPPDQEFFDRNNPLRLAAVNGGLDTLKIYFDCGRDDDYGFYAGAEALHEALQKRGIRHEFHLYPGGHNWVYVAEHLPASLEFHSRAFGLGPRGR